MIVRGKIPVPADAAPGAGAETGGWLLSRIRRRLASFRRRSVPDPALAAYVNVYTSVAERMFPEAPLMRLERLRADLFDGRIAPSAPYYTMVTTAATILSKQLHSVTPLLLAMNAPAEGQQAYRRLLALHEAAARATTAVLDAAARGYFDTLQDALFELTREVAVMRRSVDAEHKRLHSGSEIAPPALVRDTSPAPEELPSNVIPLVRPGLVDR